MNLAVKDVCLYLCLFIFTLYTDAHTSPVFPASDAPLLLATLLLYLRKTL